AKSVSVFSGMVAHDAFGTFFKLIVLLGTALTLVLSAHARELEDKHHGEFCLMLLAVCLGAMLLSSASHLLMIYVALEGLSVVSYCIAGFLRRDRKSSEAGIKFAIYGAVASGVMLFGMSYVYGLTGSLHLSEIATQMMSMSVHSPQAASALVVLLLLVLAGFLYKIAAVPFHYWAPDVYEGAPTTGTAFFSVVPKAAGFAVLIRAATALFPADDASWLNTAGAENAIAVIAALTMTLGNLAALGQSNVKRMLAYSSIAHAGYMLAGLSVLGVTATSTPGTLGGPASVLYYLIVYLFMNLGAFLVLLALENRCGSSDLPALRGVIRREPLLVVTLCVFLFSLVGLPPLAGFSAKYLVMLELAGRNHFALIACIGLNTVISLYYYLKIAKAVAVDAPENTAETPSPASPLSYKLLAVASSVALLLLFVQLEPVHRLCREAALTLPSPTRGEGKQDAVSAK
ncbi:MAG TPA: NADH-quinone oxidoreductase subunit N, partial [Planctomycetota bacterium]|nr:NADH-quinone oxidoreductase subunit N [Planctomycetota bacterium]